MCGYHVLGEALRDIAGYGAARNDEQVAVGPQAVVPG